jgi:hypothetical protein
VIDYLFVKFFKFTISGGTFPFKIMTRLWVFLFHSHIKLISKYTSFVFIYSYHLNLILLISCSLFLHLSPCFKLSSSSYSLALF